MTHNNINRNNGSERERERQKSETKHKMAVPPEDGAAEVGNNRARASHRSCPNLIVMMTKSIERAFYRVVQQN